MHLTRQEGAVATFVRHRALIPETGLSRSNCLNQGCNPTYLVGKVPRHMLTAVAVQALITTYGSTEYDKNACSGRGSGHGLPGDKRHCRQR